MIAKNCHVRIDLDRDVSAVDERTRLTTKLTVTKNRPTSMTGPAGQLLFNMITHTLNEDLGIVESPPLQPLEHDNELESQPFD